MSRDRLRDELGADPPAGLLASLDDEQLDSLAERVGQAKRRQSEMLARAGAEALGHLPWPVRKVVLRAVR